VERVPTRFRGPKNEISFRGNLSPNLFVTNRQLWKVAVTTTPSAEEAVADLFENVFGEAVSSYTNASMLRTKVAIYLERKPATQSFELQNLRIGLQRIAKINPAAKGCKVNVSKLAREDWANSWKKHFKPIEVGSVLLIRPSWSKRRARKGQVLVQIDPGLAFGTGQHPTTAFCLNEIVARRDPQKRQSFLDLGTGSGILAIAAARLGYSPVDAIDLDPAAIKVSRNNARHNRIERRIHFQQQALAKLSSSRSPPQYDLICANLIANVLRTERQCILARLRPDGILVLAGILATEFSKIRKHYEAAGLKLLCAVTAKEWRSGCFAFSECY
jgi:ribosomal protein L11 methyltransferase